MSSATSSAAALRRALILDAAASGTMGVALAVGSRPLSELLRLPVGLLFWAGLFLIPFAGFLIWLARRARVARPLILAVVGGNLLWVVASVAIILAGLVDPSTLGTVVVMGQAAAVAVFASLEYAGVRGLRTAA